MIRAADKKRCQKDRPAHRAFSLQPRLHRPFHLPHQVGASTLFGPSPESWHAGPVRSLYSLRRRCGARIGADRAAEWPRRPNRRRPDGARMGRDSRGLPWWFEEACHRFGQLRLLIGSFRVTGWRIVAGLSRPVTPEVAGSSPVAYRQSPCKQRGFLKARPPASSRPCRTDPAQETAADSRPTTEIPANPARWMTGRCAGRPTRSAWPRETRLPRPQAIPAALDLGCALSIG